MRFILTGGGTGGHVSPATAIAEGLREKYPQAQFAWFGKRGGREEAAAKKLGIEFHAIPVAAWPRSLSPKLIATLLILLVGTLQAFAKLLLKRPDALIAVGGFVSVPATLAAQLLAIPTILHEQNKRVGMANRLLVHRAKRILISFPETTGADLGQRATLVGNPVRAGFVDPPSREDACAALDLDSTIPVILIAGGSQGARTLNDALADALHNFKPNDAQFIWATGNRDHHHCETSARLWRGTAIVQPFIEDMVTACAAATLIISRAGASTTAEIAVLAKPAILIPYPYATDAHQDANAQAFEAAGAALVFPDKNWNGPTLTETLRNLLADPRHLNTMSAAASKLGKPHATQEIVQKIAEVLH